MENFSQSSAFLTIFWYLSAVYEGKILYLLQIGIMQFKYQKRTFGIMSPQEEAFDFKSAQTQKEKEKKRLIP